MRNIQGSHTILVMDWDKMCNCRFCKEIRADNFRFWWRRVQEDTSQGMYMSKIEICFYTCSNIAKSENAMLRVKIFSSKYEKYSGFPHNFGNGLGQNVQFLERIFHRCFLPGFRSFGQAVSEEKTIKRTMSKRTLNPKSI
jgi:hypothetical protein